MASTSAAGSSSSAAMPMPTSLTQIVQSNQQYEECPHLNAELSTPYDIFLSYSGTQKLFVKELYQELSQNFNTFFDITSHSLPPGEFFPKRILNAARTCKLAVVILSDEFVCSQWSMIELSAFVDAMCTGSGIKILPLFFKFSPSNLNNERNLTRWVTKWEAFAKKDSCIAVSKWKEALGLLGSQSGLIFDAATESELAYLDRIVSSITQIVPPAIKYDAHHIQGKDRLCNVILDKFKDMETHELNSVALLSSKDLPAAARSKVLGLYGLPGNGKSTMSKCLRDHFFPIYLGKALYLELPTDPSRTELVNMFKMLLRLTDFRFRMNLDDGVLDLEQVISLLRSHQLRSRSVFLVIDNISDKSWEAVQRILLVGFGWNSKIILVARTLDILCPILNSLKHGHHCICDSLCIPNIDEREAKEILIQTIRVGLDGYIPHQRLTLEQTEIVLRIVRLCGFGPEDSRLYLPLVMKIMGYMLLKYNGDLEEWGSNLERFWTGVKMYKEDAVKELVEESFKKLPNEEIQVLFMDVALFIFPSGLQGYHEVCVLLGFMHDKSVSRMEQMLKVLERHCFLTVDEDGVSVHDVYLDFAKSMQEGSSGFTKWSWRNDICTDGGALLLREEQTTRGEHQLVRTMILEVEGCDKVELQSFSGLKAVVVRGCKSLQVLRLSGLRSLVSLEIVRCASLQRLECSDSDYTSLRNVKRLIIDPQTKGESSRVLLHVQEWEQVSYLRQFSYLLQRVIAPAKHSINELDKGIARHMRGLQVLSLEETGIRRLVDMSNYWPQLQHLTVIEDCLESFVVGNLLTLKIFHFNDDVKRYGADSYRDSESWKRRKGNPRFMLQGNNLLEGCPELEEVDIQSAFFEGGELGTLPQNVVALELSCFYTATKLPDLSSLSHKLERLTLRCCEKLERVNLAVGLRNLKDLELSHCLNVVEVRGLGSLPSLRSLRVSGCPKLQALVGFNNSRMLQKVHVCGCSELQEIACLSGLMLGLEEHVVKGSANLTSLVSAECENLMELETLDIDPLSNEQSGCVSLKGLRNLEILELGFGSGTAINKTGGLFHGLESLVKLCLLELRGRASSSNEMSLLDFSGLVPADDTTLTSGLCSIKVLSLDHWPELAGMDGIQHILTLTHLYLTNLENLKSLQGLEFLIHLRWLVLENCPLLAELPSLHALVNIYYLSIKNCPKIKAVEGCNEMKGLHRAVFDGCESLSCLPFRDLLRNQRLHLEFRRCKFADTMERVVAWAVEEETPRPLRLASLRNLTWEYYNGNEEEKERVVKAFFPCLFDRLLPHDDDCIDFQALQQRWNDEKSKREFLWDVQFPSAAAQELELKLRGKPKRDLLQNFQMHKLALLRFLDDAKFRGAVLYCELLL